MTISRCQVSGKEWFAFFLADMPSAWDRLKVIEKTLNAVPVAEAAPLEQMEEAIQHHMEEAIQMEEAIPVVQHHYKEPPPQVLQVEEAIQRSYVESSCCRMLGLCNGREDFGVLRSFGWSDDGSLERPL